MIHVARGPAPKFMESPEFLRLEEQYAQFREYGGTAETQTRFDLDGELRRWADETWAALERQFAGRCAYTEVPLVRWRGPTESTRKKSSPSASAESDWEGVREGRLTHHRPLENATSLDGRTDPDHYWWLALEWDNWYLASDEVRRAKSSLFPVTSERLPDGETDVTAELAVLLDPCRDWPAWWLRFDEGGAVAPRALLDPVGEGSRGDTSIRVLGLNSERLVEERRRWTRIPAGAADVVILADELIGGKGRLPGVTAQLLARRCVRDSSMPSKEFEAAAEILLQLAPDALAAEFFEHPRRYGAVKRRVLRGLLDHVASQSTSLAEGLDQETADAGKPRPTEAAAQPPDPAAPPPQSQPAAGPPAAPAAAKQAQAAASMIFPTDQITHVRIENFRAIRELELTIPAESRSLRPPYGSSDSAVEARGWTVLLGENGSGKSSILQAIALALTGKGLFRLERAGLIRWDRLLRRGAEPARGRIRLGFLGDGFVDLRFDAEGARFEGYGTGDGPVLPINCRAYGATRLMADAHQEAEPVDPSVHATQEVGNLFDPGHAVLVHAERLLTKLDPSAFNLAAVTLGDLLDSRLAPRDADGSTRPSRFRIEDGEVLVDDDHLATASDGYRTVTALACDIMSGIGGLSEHGWATSDVRESMGIVLVDEIGAHLHPRWRMEITGKLRRAFPNVQFIVSTHEPLCLRGLQEGEVVRVHKDPAEGVITEVIDRSPEGYRVDQLLTSEYFGLSSAIDPDVDRKFARYYQLRSREDRSPEEEEEFAELDRELNEETRMALGYSRRGQLIFEAIDDFMASRDQLPASQRRKERQALVTRVREIWTSLDRMMPGADA